LVFAENHGSGKILDSGEEVLDGSRERQEVAAWEDIRLFDYVGQHFHHGYSLFLREALVLQSLDEFESVEMVVSWETGGGREGSMYGIVVDRPGDLRTSRDPRLALRMEASMSWRD
jgi:hypothetical protein